MRSLVINPLIPASLWSALAAACLLAVAAYLFVRPPRVSARRRAAMGACMALAFAGLLGLLLNPTWEEIRRGDVGRPTLAVLLDVSESMATPDCAGRARIQAAVAQGRALERELAEQFAVQFWTFDTDLRPVPSGEIDKVAARGIATDLGRGLHQALRSSLGEEAAIVVLSDGIHNVPDTQPEIWRAAQTARAMAVPVFTRTFGTDATVKDLRLDVVTPDNVAFAGTEAPVRARLQHTGFGPGLTCEVTLRADGQVVEKRTVAFGEEAATTVEFTVKQDRAGVYRYTMEAAPLPQEVVRANNQGVFHLRVTDAPLRALLLEGKPYWDLKFLTRELAAAHGVTVTSIVRLKDGRFVRRRIQETPATGAKPAEQVEILTGRLGLLDSYQELTGYDVILLGRDVDAFLDDAAVENLCRWIGDWGGSLVCARGRPLQVMPAALDRVMPVRWRSGVERRFRVHATEEGDWIGWFPSGSGLMPSLATDAQRVEEKPLASVLARASADKAQPEDSMAAVSWQQYGAGRVVVAEGSGLWRWAFLPPGQAPAHHEVYPRFWNNLVRWLAASADFLPGETARLRPAQAVFTELNQPALFLLLREADPAKASSAPVILVQRREGGAPPIRLAALPGASPNLYRAASDPLPAGAYVARLESRDAAHPVECAFEVIEPVAERLDLLARPALLKRLAEETGGAALEEKAADVITRTYLERWKERHPEEFRRTPAWDRPALLAAFGALAAILWVIRRRGGLV